MTIHRQVTVTHGGRDWPIDETNIIAGLRMVRHAASTDGKPMPGALIYVRDGMLRVGATDGFRLAIADVHPAGDIPPDIWAHVSAETARAIRKGRPIPKCDPPDGAYPDLPSVVPAGEPMAVIDLSQSSSIVSAALRACTLDRRFVVSVAAEHDEARVYLPAGVRLIVPARVTTPAEVRIDRDYLADALDAGCTRMEIRGALTPVMLARSGLTCVIMPVRQ